MSIVPMVVEKQMAKDLRVNIRLQRTSSLTLSDVNVFCVSSITIGGGCSSEANE